MEKRWFDITTAYHPQSNGLVERFQYRSKDALRARAGGSDVFTTSLRHAGDQVSLERRRRFFSCRSHVWVSVDLLGPFLSSPEPPSPSFFADFQGVLAARPPLQTSHHSTAAPTILPADLLSRFVLVLRDGVQPPLSPLYDGPYLVLKRSLHSTDRVEAGFRLRSSPEALPRVLEKTK